MANEIKCPKCGNSITLNEIMSDELSSKLESEKEKLRLELITWKNQKEEDFRKEIKLTEESAKAKASEELQQRLQLLEEEARRKAEQLSLLQKKELDMMRMQNEMEQKLKDFDFEKEKYVLEKTREIEEAAIRKESMIFDLKLKEKELQMESMKKTIDDLKRKSEQGSMQVQGEAQELLLEETLKEHFPTDLIEEIGKGAEGADCIQVIRSSLGKECGKIIYESKRTKNWSNGWIDKLKTDMRSRGADVAVLVTQAFPKDMNRFGEKEGVWICNFNEVTGVSHLLRMGIMRVHESHKAQENKGEKMQMLYDYLTGVEFKGQVEAIAEGFLTMKRSILRERMQMEKLWKEREKQLEKVLINTTSLYGSVKGIAGASLGDIPALDGDSENLLLDNE
jgi:hypothetical protein